MRVLVTGAAGFIGFHLCLELLKQKKKVVGVDSLNNYYDVNLKKKRINIIKQQYKNTFKFIKGDLSRKKFTRKLEKIKFNRVIHLAAQAGVRHSLIDPNAYTKNNIEAFINILELSRNQSCPHLLYASSSSVYGYSLKKILEESDECNHPLQLYAATKRANELMAHSYSSLFNLPTTGLRFFTVYGPWGRPDMSLFLFTKKIIEGKKIEVFNDGNHERSFTYVSDICKMIIKLTNKIPSKKNKKKYYPDESFAPYSIVNLGNPDSIKLLDYIKLIENTIEKKAKIVFKKLQPGDIFRTKASVNKIFSNIKKFKHTDLKEGIKNFVSWYKSYYKIGRW